MAGLNREDGVAEPWMSVCDSDGNRRNLDVALQGVPAVVGTSVSGPGGEEVLGIGGACELLA